MPSIARPGAPVAPFGQSYRPPVGEIPIGRYDSQANVDDRRPDSEPDSPSLADPGEVEGARDAPGASQPGRREFIRHLSRDAAVTAGRLAGLSSIVRRTVVAAGEAAARDLEPSPADSLPTDLVSAPAEPVTSGAPSAPAMVPDPVLTLTPVQHDLLANASTATLAVNDPAGAPHLTSSMYHWDGETVRLPTGMFTARTMDVERDPRVSLLIADPVSGAWLALTGVASLVYGPQVEVEMMPLLSKYLDAEAATDRWEEMNASGDQAVILIRPTRLVWRPA
jgi:Pyridoxamine 5'-phosphate oxidase